MEDRYLAYPWMTRLESDAVSGLAKPSVADAFQVRALSLQRFVAKIGDLSGNAIDEIAEAVALCVGLAS